MAKPGELEIGKEALRTPGEAQMRMPAWTRESVWYAAAVGVSFFLASVLLDLPHNPVGVPWQWGGDYLLNASAVRTIIDDGWVMENPRLGAPFGLQYYDFPMHETWHYGVIKVLSWFLGERGNVNSPFLLLNLYYVLTFPLTTLTTMALLRFLRVGQLLALWGAVLYTFMPYHFLRVPHTMLAAYYPVPLVIIAVMMVSEGRAIFVRARGEEFWRLAAAPHWKIAAGLGCVAVMVGMGGPYYAAFAILFLATAGMIGVARTRRVAAAVDAVLMSGIIAAAVAACVIPTFLYQLHAGVNPERPMQRTSGQTVTLGLKLEQLLLPRSDNRFAPLAKVGVEVASHPLVNENQTATLGVLLSGAFGLLLVVVMTSGVGISWPSEAVTLANLNIAGVLFGTMGGLGAVFSDLINAQIRAVNRISIFLALFCVAGLVVVLREPVERWMRTENGKMFAYAALVLVGLVAILDMVPPKFAIHSDEIRAELVEDARFVGQIEARVPTQGKILQLPYVAFPETAPFPEFKMYDHLRLPLLSRQLRFSFGVMRGRREADWLDAVSHSEPASMLNILALAGFSGVVVEARAYPERHSPAPRLASLLQQAPLVNGRGDAYFFDLQPLAAALRKRMGDAAFLEERERLLASTPIATATEPSK